MYWQYYIYWQSDFHVLNVNKWMLQAPVAAAGCHFVFRFYNFVFAISIIVQCVMTDSTMDLTRFDCLLKRTWLVSGSQQYRSLYGKFNFNIGCCIVLCSVFSISFCICMTPSSFVYTKFSWYVFAAPHFESFLCTCIGGKMNY